MPGRVMSTSSEGIEFQIFLVSSLVEMYFKMQKHTRCVEIVQQDVNTQMSEGIGTTSNAIGREGITHPLQGDLETTSLKDL
jgi:hypothetical protein